MENLSWPGKSSRGTIPAWPPWVKSALEITDPSERERYAEAAFQKIGFRPEEPEYHCFAIDIQSAAANTLIGEEFQHQVWKAG